MIFNQFNNIKYNITYFKEYNINKSYLTWDDYANVVESLEVINIIIII